VAGPKAILDHTHYTDGGIRTVDYGNYAANTDYVVSINGGGATTEFNDSIDGGTA
jgi:hypothetical protein